MDRHSFATQATKLIRCLLVHTPEYIEEKWRAQMRCTTIAHHLQVRIPISVAKHQTEYTIRTLYTSQVRYWGKTVPTESMTIFVLTQVPMNTRMQDAHVLFSKMTHNKHAHFVSPGAVQATNSKLNANGSVAFISNTAGSNGGIAGDVWGEMCD